MGRHNLLPYDFIWLKIKRGAQKIKYLIEKTFVIKKLQMSFFYARDMQNLYKSSWFSKPML